MLPFEQKTVEDLDEALAMLANEEAATIPKTPLKSPDVLANELFEKAKKNVRNFHERLTKGIEDLLQHGIFVKGEKIDESKIPALVETLCSEQNLAIPMHKKLGISDEVLLRAYEYGSDVFRQQRYEQSGNVFIVLCFLNPFVASFWIGLAMSEELLSSFHSAGLAYLMALEVNPDDLEPALHSARCFFSAVEDAIAQSVLYQVIEEAGKAKRDVKIREEAHAMLKKKA